MTPIFILAVLAAWSGPVRIVAPADPLSDKRQVYALVGDADHHLAVGCEVEGSRDVEAVIKFGRHIGDAVPGIFAGGRELNYRLDQASAETVWWGSSGDTITARSNKAKPMRFHPAA